MNELLKRLTSTQSQSPSILKDPFNAKNITSVSMNTFLSRSGMFTTYGSVSFKNGDTEGEQKFKADSMDELYEKIRTFINNFNQ